MFKLLNRELSQERIDALEEQIAEAFDRDATDEIEASLRPIRKRLRHQRECALALIRMIESGVIPIGTAVKLVLEIFKTYQDELEIISKLGEAMEGARDIDQLNLAAPDEPVFQAIVDKLATLAKSDLSSDDEVNVLTGLSTAARMTARQHDDVARFAFKRLIEIEPDGANRYYNYGLFLKTRGFFKKGMAENATARSLVAEPAESYEWNFGICATGADEGTAALEVWKQLGQKIEMGRFGLPEGGYPQCKVRLAERPLAERAKDQDDPGLEETIWIERLSPCHGIIRSVLYQKLDVDYGDVVLIDGAPITYHTYGEREIPVFPHLATLRRNGYQFFDFVGTQKDAGQLEDASADLAGDAIVYSHSEKYRILCATCWRDPNIDHEHHQEMEKHVVKGRIAAPGDVSPKDLLEQLDNALANRESCRIYSPALCEAAGETGRAAVELSRFEMVVENSQ